MEKGKKYTVKQTKATEEGLGVYVNLLTDFGFKRIFGIKEVMIHFLNTVLEKELKDRIVDLHYDNTERPGITRYDRKAYYDLFCSTEKGERFIVEIQALWQEFYRDKALFYASYLVQDQNVRNKEWDFKLQPVYMVNIVNFLLDENDPESKKYTSYVQLIDRQTHKVFYDKLTFVYIELPRFTKELKDVKTFFEKWIYLISNLHNMDDESSKKFADEVFGQLFEEAKIARMTKEEKNTYYTSLKNYRAMNLAKIELNKLHNTIAIMGNDLAVRDNTIAAMQKAFAAKEKAYAAKEKENAELRRKLGLLN